MIYTLPLALTLSLVAHADHHKSSEHDHNYGAAVDVGTSVFKASFLGNYDYTTGHVVQLAEAIPADKYNWAPAEGVRSVEKAILHIAAANYMLGSKLGAKLPNGLDPMAIEAEDHDKAKAVKRLKDSIAFARQAVSELPDEKLADPIELFGMQLNKMSVALIIAGHANEHLGQLIAYARSNDITPPWSE